MSGTLDEALERLAGFGVETATGSPNHGPMAVQALIDLDCADVAIPWVNGYVQGLSVVGGAVERIETDCWPEALGAGHRFTDWRELFARELDTMSWQDLLALWLVRLWPGGMAVGGHGPIRTAHAVRALAEGPTEPRIDELISALAYWAARYQKPAGTVLFNGTLDIWSALDRMPHLDERQQRSGVPPKVLRLLDDLPEFAQAVDQVSAPTDPLEQLHELSLAGVGLYRRNTSRYPLVFIHTITATEAVRVLLPYTPVESQLAAYRFAWQYIAATTAAFGAVDTATPPEIEHYPTVSETVEHCIASGDEHAFKLTAACLIEYQRRSKPAFLAVADDWSTRMLAARDWDHNQLIAAGLAFI